MSLIRPFSALDLFEFNSINLDVWTETYGVNYYLSYLNHWGDLFSCVGFLFFVERGADLSPHSVVESAGGAGKASGGRGSSGGYGGGEGGGLMGYGALTFVHLTPLEAVLINPLCSLQ